MQKFDKALSRWSVGDVQTLVSEISIGLPLNYIIHHHTIFALDRYTRLPIYLFRRPSVARPTLKIFNLGFRSFSIEIDLMKFKMKRKDVQETSNYGWKMKTELADLK